MATDHLGNTRAVVSTTNYSDEHRIEQKNSYYAYGGIMDDVLEGADVQTHKYNGKELDRMHGLDWYDYSARQYDATIGQFTSMDPLCEKYYHISPYVYCAGNPVKYVDPDGRDYTMRIDEDNKTLIITATYYVESGHDEFNAAKKFWNELSGQYTIGDYSIIFDISAVDNKDDAMNTFKMDVIKNGDGDAAQPSTEIAGDCDGKNIRLNNHIDPKTKNHVYNASTAAHELGHSLGFSHYDSNSDTDKNNLMFFNGAERSTEPVINTNQIKTMIQHSISGKPDFDISADGSRQYEGRRINTINWATSVYKHLYKGKIKKRR